MSITEVCVRRPVLAWMIMAATIVFGVVAAQRIGVSQMPDVDFPTVSVNVTWEGAAPEVIENDVVQVLESIFTELTRRVGPPAAAAAAPGAAAELLCTVPVISTWRFRCFEMSAVCPSS